jgi:hypothetical protein
MPKSSIESPSPPLTYCPYLWLPMTGDREWNG